ncbi:MAG: phage terminase large subunit [Proteobacteria bacterium]|nr:phage terminase large subunit [Pseudomonadota bacterium]
MLESLAIEQSRRSFWAYRQYMRPQMLKGWWQREIARNLQEFYRDFQAGKRPKLVIQSPPQHGKSEQVVDFISWLCGQNPDLRVIYTSFSERLGVRANLRLQRVFDSEKYRRAFPQTRINTQNVVTVSSQTLRNREIIEFSGREGYFRNTTVRGSITGESLDIGVIDDPIKGREEANSETVREKTWDWLTDDFLSRFSENAGLLAILTRWHVDDPIGRLIEHMPDVKVVSYPAIAEEDEPYRKKGEALFPELKSLEFLEERRAAMFAPYWEALYQQNPTLQSGELFKPDHIQIVEAVPHGVTRWVRGWDLASTVDGDYTAGAKIGRLPDGRYVIADMVRIRSGPDERDAILRRTAESDGKGVRVGLPQDPGQAGKTQALYLTRQLSGYVVKTSPESGDKVTRAEPFAAQVNVGNVLMLRGAWNSVMTDEMRTFPHGKHDDQIDALSRAFAELLTKGSGFLFGGQSSDGNTFDNHFRSLRLVV